MGSIPFEGFASKSEALIAFYQGGMAPEAIAARLGWTLANVRQVIRQKRLAVDGTAGIWTPEKIDKARRLFGKTMIYIAEALNVPPEELLHYALDGAVPPMGLSGRLGDIRARGQMAAEAAADEAAETKAAPLLLVAPEAGDSAPEEEAFHAGDVTEAGADLGSVPVAPPDEEPETAEPEAELEPGEDELAAPAGDVEARVARSAAPRFRLLAGTGRYVHESLEGFTPNRRFAWCGNRRQLVKVIALNPKFKRYDVEPVF